MFSHKLVTAFINGLFCLFDVNTGNTIKDFLHKKALSGLVTDVMTRPFILLAYQYLVFNLLINIVYGGFWEDKWWPSGNRE